MRIALGQINPTVGDFAGNSGKIIENAQRAQAAGAYLILFPELAVCGYPPRDLVEKPAFVARNSQALEEIARAVPGIAVVCGYVSPARVETGKAVMNSAALLRDGVVQFVQSKMLLPSYDVFDEVRYFAPAPGQQVFPLGGQQLAITVCEDAWNDKHFWHRRLYSIDPVDELLRRGANLVLNISASPFHLGKRELRHKMLATIARDNNVPVAMVNQVGGNDSLIFDGSSVVIAPNGHILAQGKSFEEDLIFFDSETLRGDMHPQLPGVAMPSQYSSEGSVSDARELAANLGIRFEVVPIAEIFTAYRNALSPVFAGLPEDVTEENIQSRIRGAILMAFSNKFNCLVLTTGNKSELGVGYCTLYGDMVGGLAVISDVPKTMVYRIGYYVNSLRPVIPKSTLEKPPSAELRPGQLDSDSLPPYEILDNILEDYVEDYHAVEQIASERGYDLGLVRDVIRRIERSEYKRQQAALGLKITPKAFGVGRRFPIAQKLEI